MKDYILNKLNKLNKKMCIQYTSILTDNDGCKSVDKDFMLVISTKNKTFDFFMNKEELRELREEINKKLNNV